MKATNSCQSCGMTINAGVHCEFCAGDDGQLRPFDEHFERMVQWALSEHPDTSRKDAEEGVKAYMKTMPAWENHPNL